MRTEIRTCDRCGVNAGVCCDLVVPVKPRPALFIPFWPWKSKGFDLCETCASDLLAWIQAGGTRPK